MNPTILVVEDDPNLGFLLQRFLRAEGYQVTLAQDGLTAWELFQTQRYDLCVLDVMMPEMDGFSLARKLAHSKQRPPFIFLTAKSMKEDRLTGYALGAEDYITKPFDQDELLCKIKVILRRQSETEELPTQFQLGHYHYDYSLQALFWKGTPKRLTEKENEVLYLLCQHQNQILRRDDAVTAIYGKADYFLGRSFDVFISKIRKLLQQDPHLKIENVFKVGFIFRVPNCTNK